ncbi:hypothetical protein AHF37_09704 [Paragonimus kellicotti]|nr:hypothetical protein AHF37_09704 [Paragonimus kellicotti]
MRRTAAFEQVTKFEAECLAQRLGDLVYIETSSITGENIERSFEVLAEAVYANVIRGEYRQLTSTGDWDGVKVSENAKLAASIAQQSLRMQSTNSESPRGCC